MRTRMFVSTFFGFMFLISGVTVRVKGKSYSRITNNTGTYEIKANLNDTLQFYLKDYTEQEDIGTKVGNLSIK